MSVKVMHWVFEASESRGNARLVLLAIADWAGDDGEDAWPSLASIAAKAKVSRRTAIRCVEELVALGELDRVRGGGRLGRGGTSNGYRVLMKQGQPVTTFPGRSGDATDTTSSDRGGDTCVTTSPDPSGDADGTSDRLALVTPEHEVVSNTTGSGDTGGTRSVKNRYNRHRASDAPKPKASRRSQAPDTFTVTDELYHWAQSTGLDIDLEFETEKFLDYHGAKGNKFADWTRAWRNWMRNAQTFTDRDNPTKQKQIEI